MKVLIVNACAANKRCQEHLAEFTRHVKQTVQDLWWEPLWESAIVVRLAWIVRLRLRWERRMPGS